MTSLALLPSATFLSAPRLVLLARRAGCCFCDHAWATSRVRQARSRRAGDCRCAGLIVACVFCLGQEAVLFDGAYRVDAFSQVLKLVFAVGSCSSCCSAATCRTSASDVKPEYFLFLTLSVTGLTMLVSCIDLITLVVALELSAFPLYVLVAMRREREGQRARWNRPSNTSCSASPPTASCSSA